MAKKSPTERTLHLMRANGYTCGITEHYNAHAGKRYDLYGFVDVLAMKPGHGIVAIQATTDDHRSHRRKKIEAEPRASLWQESGGEVWLLTWGKKGLKGNREVWRPHIERMTYYRGDIGWEIIELDPERMHPFVPQADQTVLPIG